MNSDELAKYLTSETVKKEKPFCTCTHPLELHAGGRGPCARNTGGMNSCWCDGYEPNDSAARLAFPVVPLGKLEGE